VRLGEEEHSMCSISDVAAVQMLCEDGVFSKSQILWKPEAAKNLGSGKSGSLAIRQTAWSARDFSHPRFVDQHTDL